MPPSPPSARPQRVIVSMNERADAVRYDHLGNDWIETRLGHVIELKRGYDLPAAARKAGSVPVVSSSGITDYHSESKVPGPGVVTGRYGTIGRVFYIPGEYWPLNTALYVSDFRGNDPRFIGYLLARVNFSIYSDKSTVPGLNRNHLHQEIVRIPKSVSEQRAIAHVLGALDDRIDLNRRMNETLAAMARALFRSWFVDFEPVHAKLEGRDTGLPRDVADLFPDRFVKSKRAAGAPVPRGWQVGALADVVEIINGGTPRTSVPEYWDGDIPWYTAKDAPSFNGVFAIDTERTISRLGVAHSSTRLLPARTTVITARGTVGKIACLGVPMAMNQTCYGIRGRDGYPDFFTYWNLRASTRELPNLTHGTIFDTITRETFAVATTIIPATRVADTFDDQVAPYMERILANQRASRNLTAQRDTLLPKLISGELRVEDAARGLPAAGAADR